jgi:hypothetical protein
VRIGDLRVLRQSAEPRRQLSVAAPIHRVEQRSPGELRLRLGSVRERRLHCPQEQIRRAARGDRSGGGLQLAHGDLLLREPGRRVALVDEDAVVLRRIPRGHVCQLIDGAAFGAELRGEMSKEEEDFFGSTCYALSRDAPHRASRAVSYQGC